MKIRKINFKLLGAELYCPATRDPTLLKRLLVDMEKAYKKDQIKRNTKPPQIITKKYLYNKLINPK